MLGSTRGEILVIDEQTIYTKPITHKERTQEILCGSANHLRPQTKEISLFHSSMVKCRATRLQLYIKHCLLAPKKLLVQLSEYP